jgi:hypothetical protein
MRKNLRGWFVLTLSLVILTGCNYIAGKSRGQVVAECYGKALYKSDLTGLIMPGTTVNDSLEITKQFIENWIKQQVMLKQAESNLTDDQKDFKTLLESYRNSLVIYEYESELIKQKLDTIVTEEQVEYFYNMNKGNFLLNENIVKVNYLKIPANSIDQSLVKKLRALVQSSKEKDKDDLMETCQNSPVSCYFDDDNWIRLNDLALEIPVDNNNQDQFLGNRTFYETSDSLFTYMVYFKEIQTKGSTSPLSFESNNIRTLILNRRKVELVDRMQQEVFQEALKNKEFTIY